MSNNYTKAELPKKGGGVRVIYAPSRGLRRKLKAVVPALSALCAQRLPHAHAFMPGRSAGTAARLHAGRAVTVSWDLRSWFDSVREDQVRSALRGDYTARVLDLGALIDGAPRQGLPTSPALANLAAQPLDEALAEYVSDAGVYTRYADDLTISVDDPSLVEHLLRDVPRIVERVTGWEIHSRKTSVQWARSGRRVICGVAVGDGPEVYATRKARRRARAAAHHVACGDASARDSARGLAEWCAQRLPLEAALSQRIGGRQPTSALIEHLDMRSRSARLRKRRVVEQFDARSYLRARRWLDQHAADQQESDRDRWAVALACTFGSSWQGWVQQCSQRGWSVHDACYWLPIDVIPSDGLGSALLRWRRDVPDLAGRTSELQIVASWWSRLSAQDRQLSFSDLLKTLRSKAYIGAKHAEFAQECAKWGVKQDKYSRLESRWLNSLRGIKYESIPRIEVQDGKYTAKILDKNDPRALWAGSHTACCQHPGGVGEDCAWHAVSSPKGAILAIELGGKIVAQSWVWRSGDIICCDNIESLQGRHRDDLPKMYDLFARAIVGKLGIKEVRVGTGSSDCDLDQWPIVPSVDSPSRIYSDAKKQRKIK